MRWLALVVLIGCGRVDFNTRVDALGPWSAPERVVELSSASAEDDPTLTADMLEVYFNSSRPGGSGMGDVWVATRATTAEPFGTPTLVAVLDSASSDTTPEVSGDGLTLHFSSARPGGTGQQDIYVTTRVSRSDVWPPPVRVPELASMAGDESAVLSADSKQIYFDSERSNGVHDTIYMATRPDRSAMWSTPLLRTDLDGPGEEENPFIATSDLSMWMTVDIAMTGNFDIYLATRPTPDAPFSAAQPISELNTSSYDVDPWVSPDERTIYFASTRDGASHIYRATR